MAKRTTRKQSKARKPTKAAKRRKAAPKARKRASSAKASAPRGAARKTNTKVARKKTAARAAATRSTRTQPKPKEPSRLSAAAATVKGVVAGAVAAVAKRMPGATPDMDAITLLETDHRRFEKLLKQGEETTERAVKGRGALLDTITTELGIHELIEEQILYPALKEHHVADLILKELHEVAKSDEQWGAKFKVLKESIEHHIKEEEGQMFRTARGVMSQQQLRDLGARMAQMKRDAEQGRLPKTS